MPRFAAILVASLAVAVPVPKAKKADLYPHAVGTKWEFIHDGNEKRVYVEEVVEVTEKDGTTTFKVDITTDTGGKQVEVYKLKGGELALAASSDGEYSTPMVLRTGEFKPGDSWTNKYTLDGVEYEEEVSVGKPEEITTPAGKFTCHPVSRKYSKPCGFPTNVFWIADGVGVVRHTIDGFKEPRQELKAFTLGKK